MLAQDKTAFIEAIEVTAEDKGSEKHRRRVALARVQVLQLSLDVRMSADALKSMEFELAGGEPALPLGQLRGRYGRVTKRDVDAARSRFEKKRDALTRQQARLNRLEHEAHEPRPQRSTRLYRLHSAYHHIECSERRFAQWSDSQRMSPVWVTTKDRRRWWWYSDRFWWDDEGLSAEEVEFVVREWDREGRMQREAIDQVRADRFRRIDPLPDE